jgi:hypothetical protein
MNKLRELIAKYEGVRAIISGWKVKAIHRDNLEDYLMENADAIADLIDDAHAVTKSIHDHDHLTHVAKLALTLEKIQK